MRTTSRRLLALVLALLLLATAAGCKKKHDAKAAAHPPLTIPDITTTTLPDFSGVQLAAVPGRTTTTIGIQPGGATITGTVTSPEGPVPGAVVHVERLVGDSVAAIDVGTDGAGRYAAAGILGGRYRVRAFVPHPVDLAQTNPAILFLGANESKVQDLQVDHHNGATIIGVMAPNPPQVDLPANLVVQVTTESVDPKGFVRGTPVPGATVLLAGSSSWAVNGPNSGLTDAQGRAAFQLTCTAEGPQPLQAVVNGGNPVALDIGACFIPPPPTTTTTSTATTAPPPPTTATTKPPAQTTTTRRPANTTTTKKP